MTLFFARRPLPRAGATIERAELRALRLFLCSPVCRDPLAVLVITHPLYRQAQQCLVEPHLASLLEGLCTMEAAAREALFLAPEGELMCILNVLEPVE